MSVKKTRAPGLLGKGSDGGEMRGMGEREKGAKLLAGWELTWGLVGTRSQRDAEKKPTHNMNEGREKRWSQVRQIKQGRSLGPGRRPGEGEAYLSQQVLV